MGGEKRSYLKVFKCFLTNVTRRLFAFAREREKICELFHSPDFRLRAAATTHFFLFFFRVGLGGVRERESFVAACAVEKSNFSRWWND